MYRIDTVFFLILLFFEMQKTARAELEVHFLKKLAFVTSKLITQDPFRKYSRATENL